MVVNVLHAYVCDMRMTKRLLDTATNDEKKLFLVALVLSDMYVHCKY